MSKPEEASKVSLGPAGDFEILIGSNSKKCKVCISSSSDVAPQHAVLKRVGDWIFLKDLGSKAGTYLNGNRIGADQWCQVCAKDTITIVGTPIRLHPDLFRSRDRFKLETSRLRYLAPNRPDPLCNGPFISAEPGTMTAIMGPSGCGKTVLLNLLNGYHTPTNGRIFLSARKFSQGMNTPAHTEYNLRHHYNEVREVIGYVPQDEIMIPELSVRESLDYRLQLRFRNTDVQLRELIIRKTFESMGFTGERLNNFLNTPIGSAESGIRGLSGGERRRANMAHELVTQPLILVLDEPTSGLSSADSGHIVRLLRELANNDGMTIITTIHQPSREEFERFDNLLLLTYGGRIAYYGPTRSALSYFGITNPGVQNTAEHLLKVLTPDKKDDLVVHSERIVANFEQKRTQLPYIPSPLPDTERRTTTQNPQGSGNTQSVSLLRQWFVLFQRNIRVLLSDKKYLKLLFGQVPIIALLMFFAFFNIGGDEQVFDEFARSVYMFDQLKTPYVSQGRPVPVDRLISEATAKAGERSDLISEFAGRRRGAIYFILIAACIWFGIMGACKEIVVEQHILRRESRSCIHLFPYLTAKMAMLVLLVGIQSFLLTVMVNLMLLQLPFSAVIFLWIISWFASIAAAAIGLLVSSMAGTYRVALTWVPLILIPQLVFGGLVRPIVHLGSGNWWPQIIGFLTVQRWAFEAALGMDSYAKGGVLKQQLELRLDRLKSGVEELNIIRFTDSSIVKSFFPEWWGGPIAAPLLFLLLISIGSLGFSYYKLRDRFYKE